MKTRTLKTDEIKNWPFIRWIPSRQRWMVDARTALGGKRTFHATKAEAEGQAAIEKTKRANEGNSAFDSRELAKYGWTVQKAIRFALDHLKEQERGVLLSDAIAKLVVSKKADGTSEQYQKDLKNRLGRLAAAMPEKKISSITTSELNEFLRALDVSPGTRNTFRRDIRTLWSFAEEEGWAEAATAKKTKKMDVVHQPEIFTPEEAARLLSASDEDVLVFHALGLFAGLRVSEIHKLDWSDIDLEENLIQIDVMKSKTATHRNVPILPALKAWIEPLAKKSGSVINPMEFRKRQELARNRAGFTPEIEGVHHAMPLRPWPSNGLRHSFVSYRLQSTQDAAKTAIESGHSEGVMNTHYKRLVKPKAAEAFFAIRPTEDGKVVSITAAA